MSIYFKNSNIVKNNGINHILDWLEIKPKSFELVLDSKIDGDLTSIFYEKCGNKKPTLLSLNQKKGLDLEGLQMKLGLIIFLKVIQKVLFFLWIKKENIKLLKKKMLFF